MYVDASAIVAIFAKEPERDLFDAKIDMAPAILISPVTIYEATLALARLAQNNLAEARFAVHGFVARSRARLVAIDQEIGEAALNAYERFGKGRHKAALNMGDCFSYACAKVHRVPLLFKGNDFIHTDIRAA